MSGTKSIQEKVESFLNDVFGKWGLIVARNPCKVFWISILCFLALCGGMGMRRTYEDESIIWTPAGNPSLLAAERQKEMFPSKGGFIGVIFEVKDSESSILTVDSFKEMKQFRDEFFEVEHDKGFEDEDGVEAPFKFDDICVKVGPPGQQSCLEGESPLTFALNQQSEIDLGQFSTDAELVEKVQSGKGGRYQGNGNIITVEPIFGGSSPDSITQDETTGENDLTSAKAATMGFVYEFGDIPEEEIFKYDLKVEEFAAEFSGKSKFVSAAIFSGGSIAQAFESDLESDLNSLGGAVGLVVVYCILFMGSFSPIHFRSAAAGIALLCVGLSYGASNGLAYLLGAKSAGIHNLLPFMLIGIGVDDMFVISSAIDQTNARNSVEERLKEGMIHAGASITITSFTNGVAFFLGCTSSLDALSSFCFFCGLGVIALFFASVTIFSAFMVWDIRRQAAKVGDCCGLCSCSEKACCGGRLLTPKQKAYPFQGEESDPVPEMQYANGTQKFLYESFSLATTSKVGKIVILSVWLTYSGICIWGSSQIDIDFKNTYFISGTALVNDYLDRSDKYYKSGDSINIITDNSEVDFTTEESQKALMDFNEKLKACDGCEQNWLKEETFSSWYEDLQAFAIGMNEEPNGNCTGAWDSSKEIIVPAKFYPCLDTFLQSPEGNSEAGNILFKEKREEGMIGFRQSINAIYIDSAAKEGVAMLLDIRKITDGAEIQKTFSHAERYNDYESYVVFEGEAILNILSALAAVFVLLIIFTANLVVTLLVLLCVGLVDLFLLAMLHFWGMTLNSVTIVNCVIAIGLAVDYSAHIGHAYLTVDPPENDESGKPLSDMEKRRFKARGAVGQMGPSVFHGAFSTFLAIIVLSPSKSYIFKMFFRMWFGIIIHGVANGFILLPVMLSLVGPLNKVQHGVQDNQVSDEETEKKNRINEEGGQIQLESIGIERE